MEASDLDKIVDKLLVFRTRMPKLDNPSLTWWQKECLRETFHDINRLISTIDYLGEAFK
tara:strand:+ start:1450 stop:1626 length:177 start_codon:yes stop_codon:yes gene_type:complete